MRDAALTELRRELAGRYDVEQELGAGGMAVVYLAKDLRHERKVAIKVLRQDVGGASADRFLREIRTVAQLHHPHILQLLDSGTAGDHLFYVMPYVEGETLRQRLEREGPLAVDEVMRIAREVADALDYAHGRGIVHRDIKPENIFLSAGHALVADFGIARAAAAAGPGTTLTDVGLAVGTPTYMSPEQATADPRVDGRSDQYALGCVVYELLAGAPPFTGPTSQAIMARHTADPVPPLRTVRAVPTAFETAIARALAKVPADRWPSTNAFAEALVNTAINSPAIRRQPRQVVIAALMLIALVATALSIWKSNAPALAEPTVGRVAIMPFDFVGDSQWLGLADGLSEALFTAFTRVEGVAPVGGARTRAFAGRGMDPRDIGRELGVSAVVSARVHVVGNRIRVTTELTDVGDRPIVREEFNADLLVDGKPRDVFDLQDILKVRILDFLQVKLSAANRAVLTRRVLPQDSLAYRLFLQARHELRDLSLDGARRAVALFEQALARDSTYADAWAGLAEAYSSLYQLDAIRPVEVASKWRTAADKAIRLDPANGYALSLRSFIRMTYDWDWEGGLEDLRAAMKASPASADVWFFYAVTQNVLAQPESALFYMRRAVSLDPTNPFLWANLGFRFRILGQVDSAIASNERSLGIDSTQWLPRIFLSELYLAKGRRELADRTIESMLRFAGDSQPFVISGLPRYYVETGRREKAREIVARIEKISRRQYVPGIYIGQARLAIGDTTGALNALESSFVNRDLDFSWWLIEYFPGFSGHPRYEHYRREVFGNLNVPRGFPSIAPARR